MGTLIETIVGAIEDKKGKETVSLDLSGFDGAITDTFVVCGADSAPQVAAIAASIEERVEERLGQRVVRVEGLQNALWVIMDYGDAMVHIFQTPMRDFYRLEQLWADAPLTHHSHPNQ